MVKAPLSLHKVVKRYLRRCRNLWADNGIFNHVSVAHEMVLSAHLGLFLCCHFLLLTLLYAYEYTDTKQITFRNRVLVVWEHFNIGLHLVPLTSSGTASTRLQQADFFAIKSLTRVLKSSIITNTLTTSSFFFLHIYRPQTKFGARKYYQ